jgi:hypothetical protein
VRLLLAVVVRLPSLRAFALFFAKGDPAHGLLTHEFLKLRDSIFAVLFHFSSRGLLALRHYSRS